MNESVSFRPKTNLKCCYKVLQIEAEWWLLIYSTVSNKQSFLNVPSFCRTAATSERRQRCCSKMESLCFCGLCKNVVIGQFLKIFCLLWVLIFLLFFFLLFNLPTGFYFSIPTPTSNYCIMRGRILPEEHIVRRLSLSKVRRSAFGSFYIH